MEKRQLVKTDKNGTKYWNTRVRCDRCEDGSGVYRWGAIQHDGNGNVIGSTYAGTCFKCGGAGYVWEIIKEYTPEYRAKLDAANEKRKAKLEAKRAAQKAELEAQAAERAAEQARREAERLAEIERNRGHYIGAVGDKIVLSVTLERTFTYEVPRFGAPWAKDIATGYVFKTDDGNTLVWKTFGGLRHKVYVEDGNNWTFKDESGKYYYEHPEEGARVNIKGVIKAHEEYNNVNQTVLARVKWIDKV